jgi:hypothetical protein
MNPCWKKEKLYFRNNNGKVVSLCMNYVLEFYVRFEVFTAARMMMLFLWVLAPLRLVGRCQHFGETYCLQLRFEFSQN